MAKIANGKLTYRDLVVAELDHPLEDFRCSECPRHIAELDLPPGYKRVWASLAKEPEEVLEEAFAEAERRDPSHRKSWVALVDGNATQLKILHKLAGQHHVELTIVLDFIHVCEYVWKASLAWIPTEPFGPNIRVSAVA